MQFISNSAQKINQPVRGSFLAFLIATPVETEISVTHSKQRRATRSDRYTFQVFSGKFMSLGITIVTHRASEHSGVNRSGSGRISTLRRAN